MLSIIVDFLFIRFDGDGCLIFTCCWHVAYQSVAKLIREPNLAIAMFLGFWLLSRTLHKCYLHFNYHAKFLTEHAVAAAGGHCHSVGSSLTENQESNTIHRL